MRTLRAAVARWLHRMADRIMPPLPGTLEAAAVAQAKWARTLVGSSGEYRRYRVFAALKKAFPHERDRVIAYAIERVILDGRHERR